MNSGKPALLALLAVLVPLACVPRQPAEKKPVKTVAEKPKDAGPSKPRFKTLTFTADRDTTEDALGPNRNVTSGKLKTVFDAEKNRFRRDLIYPGGRWRSQLFDGTTVWDVNHTDKVAMMSGTPGDSYKVWDESIDIEQRSDGVEMVHGHELKKVSGAGSTYWVYKGVTVQSEVRLGGAVVRTRLSGPIIEDAPTDPSLFKIPADYKKI